ncbi:MAG TPA: protein kinase family protein [Nocardioidaceae bacterium]|nr:protein kinase family protein [Nocardioidaceae bacterium]
MADKSIGPGTVLAGRFRLEDLVQETAGAKFWRATDQTLARNVAVNVVDAADERAQALLQAARTSATVTDGHFLRVLDAAQEDGFVYVVNEWGSGISLDKMLGDGPLPARRAAWLVKEVADAITTAHRQGIAHGRLLPENVMVTEAGSVKLIGFVVDAVLNGRPGSRDEGAPPLGEHESDVVNLAGLLYATLVGRWPGSDGSSLPDAPREHGRALRPRQVRAGVPRPLDTICDRVLNAEAHAQTMPIETAHEICAALSDFIGDPAGMQVGPEATTVLDRDELTTEPTETGGQHKATPAVPATPDPEATQAGAPLFFDDDTGVGWVSPARSRGLRSDEDQRYRPAPPPPFPEPEPRPLFAPDPPGGHRRRLPEDTQAPRPAEYPTDYHTGGHSGPGTGSLPPVWGPDADRPEDPEQTDGRESRDAGKNWLRLAAIVAGCLVLLFAVIVAFKLGRDTDQPPADTTGPSPSQATNAPSGPVRIAGVSDFDPQGDAPQEENPDQAPLAVDGDPATAWGTLTYEGNPELGLLKDGVGLVVDLGKPVEVSTVDLTLVGRPTSLDILAADKGASAPTSTDGLTRVASAQDAGPKVNLKLEEPVTTRYLVVWLTSLPPVPGGFKGQIAEIAVRS